MPRVISYETAKARQNRARGRLRTEFLDYPASTPERPMAYLHQGDPGRVTDTHWHSHDQFQIVVEGSGTLGRRDIAPYCVQFTRAYTPYGPLAGDTKTGLSYLALLTSFDAGANYFPESLERLKQVADRRPWAITRQIRFPSQTGSSIEQAVNLQEVPDMKDDQGMFAYSLTMAPNAKTSAPDPSRGSGQYLVVVKGSLWHEQKEQHAFTLVFLEPKEGPFQVHAGPQGLEAIILNFPRNKALAAARILPSAKPVLRKWQCELCAFAYDEAVGMPEDGIAAGIRWEDVPESWTCPDCGASKSDFQMVEV